MSAQEEVKVSTDEIRSGGFAPHGRVEISLQGDILTYTATGPFNLELVDALAQAQMNILQAAAPQGPWVSVAVMRGSMLASLEAFERYSQMMHVPKPASFNPLATLFVVGPEVEGGALMLPRYAAIHDSIGRVFKSFERLEPAMAWARARIDAERQRLAVAR